MSNKNSPWLIKRGHPLPLGVTVLNEGINFAIFSRHASRVVLVIDRDRVDGRTKVDRHEIELDRHEHQTGDIWHILLDTTDCRFSYGYRVHGPENDIIPGLAPEPERVLIDPFCRALAPRRWATPAPYGHRPCCRISHAAFDWQQDRQLKTPLAETIIYELHVRGFTKDKKNFKTTPGTYRELAEQIPYLKKLGITAVELMPVTEFDENDNVFTDPDSGKPLKNFWGYNPVSFFALKSGYAHDPDNHIDEFKAMVQSMHRAGIEVILDIVYNHTGEGGYDGATSSFRGIDNPVYYLLSPENQAYLNFSGCGNTLNCNHPVVRNLIIESLRYWVTEMHVDGFRFDLASILGRDKHGEVLANPPMIELIAEDPVLRDTKIIAEAWDAAGLYQVGSFSPDSRWGEWNGRFRDDVRAFMAGHGGTITKVATRFAGSSDLYQSSSRSPLSSINLITSHDGFTLYDLVSYDRKHNRPNGEENRDGDNHNISWNSGFEGVPAPLSVELLRQRRSRSMLVLLMLSQGIPMLTAGDEFGRSQGGNNNAWCQDNRTSWLNWRLAETNLEMLEFCRFLIALRKTHPIFRRDKFFGPEDEISWQYLIPGQQDWNDDTRGLGILLHGPGRDMRREDDFFLMLNGNRELPLTFTLPDVPAPATPRAWLPLINTAGNSLVQILPPATAKPLSGGMKFTVLPFGVVVLRSTEHRE